MATLPEMHTPKEFLTYISITLLPFLHPAFAHSGGAENGDLLAELAEYSLADLMEMEVYSASKKEGAYFTTPAAVHVIDGALLEQSGASTFEEALLYAPGVTVARQNSYSPLVGIRNSYDVFSDKLLVLMDGRALYNSQNSGTFWSAQDTFYPDIQQIEIIRGPGASVWGNNAVDGVINIMTKGAESTQGGYLSGGLDTEGGSLLAARHGGRFGEGLFYRVYGKYREVGNSEPLEQSLLTGEPYAPGDEMFHKQAGFRMDYLPDDKIRLSLDGAYYEGSEYFIGDDADPSVGPPHFLSIGKYRSDREGAWLNLHWKRNPSGWSQQSFQVYWDYTNRETGEYPLFFDNHVFNGSYNQTIELGSRHVVDFGGEARYMMENSFKGNLQGIFTERDEREQYSVYLQDEMSILEGRLSVLAGIKGHYSDYTGWEFQPTIRVESEFLKNQYLWASVSRVVHLPTLGDREIIGFEPRIAYFPGFEVPIQAVYQGNPEYESEKLHVYEAGWRLKIQDRGMLDISLFYNQYEDLPEFRFLESELIEAPQLSYRRAPFTFVNGQETESYGMEVSLQWYPSDTWRLTANYSYLRMESEFTNLGFKFVREDAPRHQAKLLSSLKIHDDWKLDTGLRYVDSVTYQGYIQEKISSYMQLDLQLSWEVNPDWEIKLRGKDLIGESHPEFMNLFTENVPLEIQRRGELIISYMY